MPELPEVQTVVSDLKKKIIGYKIVDFWSDWAKSIKNISVKKFKKEIQGKNILNVRRIGKNIFIDLSESKTLYIHLKMTGHLLVKGIKENQKNQQAYFDEKVNQYIHHIWTLRAADKKPKTLTLEFSDLRKFGKIVLKDTDEIKNLKEIKSLGVDAMSQKFSLKKFKKLLEKRPKALIGTFLMDQNIIAGIGNIYRSEILFEAGIHPERKIEKISDKEKDKLYKSIKKMLVKAIKMRGTSDSDYRDTEGAPGNFQKILKAYGREGQKCKRCGIIIFRKTLGQRSAFFCSRCQK